MQPEHSRGYENWVVGVAFLVSGFVFLDRFAIQYLSPFFTKDLHMDQATYGAAIGFLSVGWGLSGLLFGSLSDRLGRRRVLIPAMIAFSLLSAITGLVRSGVQLIAARFVMGATEGAAWAPLSATVALESSHARRGFNLGLVNSAATLFGFVLAPIVVTILGTTVGWRWSFAIVGLPSLILAVIVLTRLREPRGGDEQEARALARRRIREVLRHRNLWVSLVVATMAGAWIATAGAFTPLYLTNTGYHLDPRVMGVVVAIGGVGAFLGQGLLTWISDRWGRRPSMWVSLALLTLAAWAVPVTGPGPALLAVVLFVFNFGQAAVPLAVTIIPTETAPLPLAATAVAVPIFGLEVVGSFLAPQIAGALADSLRQPALPLWFAGAATLVALAVSLLYRESAPRLAGSIGAAPVGEIGSQPPVP